MSRLCLATSLLLLCLFSCVHVCAQDDSQLELRLNPAIDTCSTDTAFFVISIPETEYNRYPLNGADWGGAYGAVRRRGPRRATFLDCIFGRFGMFRLTSMWPRCADICRTIFRSQVADSSYLSKLAATNQPLDYTLQHNSSVRHVKTHEAAVAGSDALYR